jgi:hypothetical protein
MTYPAATIRRKITRRANADYPPTERQAGAALVADGSPADKSTWS